MFFSNFNHDFVFLTRAQTKMVTKLRFGPTKKGS